MAGVAAAAAPDLFFKVTELKLPDGCDVAAVNGLNDQADVVGTVVTLDHNRRAIFWDHTQEAGTVLPLLAGCDQSEAFAVNESAQVVGWCFNYSTNVYQACLWQQGAVQALPPPTGLGPVTESAAYGINDQGQAVGYAVVSGGTYPMLWDQGAVQPLESPPSRSGIARCISNNGVVGGDGFLWSKAGGFINLGGDSAVKGINGLGSAVGGNGKPCVWNSQGAVAYLGDFTSGSASGVNDLGQIVGDADGISFLWQAGKVTDLNKALQGYDWSGVWPGAINNGMQIAATGRRIDSSTISRALLLNAVTRRPRFRLTDLGPGVVPHGLGGRGEIVGENNGQAFIRQGGQVKTLGPGAAWAINGPGRIVGAGYIGTLRSAVFWDSQGIMAPLEKGSSRVGCALAVNQSGAAAGWTETPQHSQQPCVWKADGTIQFLTDNVGTAFGISDNNLVVGSHYPYPFFSPVAFACTVGGGFIDLIPDGSAGSGKLSEARAVNGSGQIVGGYSPAGSLCAFIWQAGKIQNLTKLISCANGINGAGQVVGIADRSSLFAFLWEPDLGLMDLNELLITPQPDWVLTTAYDINRNMQIIGKGKYQGVDHGFLLDRVGTCANEAVNVLLLD